MHASLQNTHPTSFVRLPVLPCPSWPRLRRFSQQQWRSSTSLRTHKQQQRSSQQVRMFQVAGVGRLPAGSLPSTAVHTPQHMPHTCHISLSSCLSNTTHLTPPPTDPKACCWVATSPPASSQRTSRPSCKPLSCLDSVVTVLRLQSRREQLWQLATSSQGVARVRLVLAMGEQSQLKPDDIQKSPASSLLPQLLYLTPAFVCVVLRTLPNPTPTTNPRVGT